MTPAKRDLLGTAPKLSAQSLASDSADYETFFGV